MPLGWLLIIIFGMVINGIFILRELKKRQFAKALSKIDHSALICLEKLKNEHHQYWANQTHISYKQINEWIDGQLDGEFLDLQLASKWQMHVRACPSCQDIIEFCRAERNKKLMEKSTKELKN